MLYTVCPTGAVASGKTSVHYYTVVCFTSKCTHAVYMYKLTYQPEAKQASTVRLPSVGLTASHSSPTLPP